MRKFRYLCLCLLILWIALYKNEENLVDACMIPYANQTLSEDLIIKENTLSSFIYPISARASVTSHLVAFVIDVKICDSGSSYSACNCRWLQNMDAVCKGQRYNATCWVDNSEMHFSLLIKRTHSDVMWELLRQNYTPLVLKHSKLQVTYPPMITGLHVNGQKVNGTHLVGENQEVIFSCFFINGNPPVTIRMVDDGGHTLSSTGNREGPLTLSRDIRCNEVWPTIRCEAPGSELNKSVAIVVKCLPRFLPLSSEFLDLRRVLHKGLTLLLKSYTRNISKCLMTTLFLLSPSKEVACEVSGSVPDLNLTLHFAANSTIGGGIWTLHVLSELGFSNITIGLVNSTSQFYGRWPEVSNDGNGLKTSCKNEVVIVQSAPTFLPLVS
ncbi:uncharacterized protein LOC112568609 [Pomacea canaliculata]|uniref:uncharacterized protein LOC112568609 n=1 Tax=Pomacea canaliculata TaxID=400727 RepID=UPI000D728D05|nr:uncharacterized protein LOC112568609 [Pomacea canaliculata]